MSGNRVVPPRSGPMNSERRRAVPDDVSSAISVWSVLRALGQWWKFAVPTAVLLAVVSGSLILRLHKPQYRAEAVVQVHFDAPFVAYEAQRSSGEDARRFLTTQTLLMRSALVLGPVVRRPDIQAVPEVGDGTDAAESLGEQLIIEQQGDSELVTIQFDAAAPEHASLVVNAVAEELLNIRSEQDTTRISRVVELLEKEKQDREAEVKTLRSSLRGLGARAIGDDPLAADVSEKRPMLLHHPLEALITDWTRAEAECRTLQAEVNALAESLQQNARRPAVALVDKAINDLPEILDLKQQLSKKRADVIRWSATSSRGIDDPQIARVRREVADLEAAMAAANDSARPRVEAELAAVEAGKKQEQLDELSTNLASAKLQEQAFRQQVDAKRESLGRSGNGVLELEFVRSELDRKEKVFGLIAERTLQLKAEMRAPSRINLLIPAQTPQFPLEELPWKYLGAAALVSMCLPISLAVGWELLIKRIGDSKQLHQTLRIPIMGEVSRLPNHSSRSIVGRAGNASIASSLFGESIDSLRNAIILSPNGDNLQVLTVASAVPGEGKTSIAAQLAVSMARSHGASTLLIDADMRAPDLHHLFGVSNEKGLVGVLRGQCTLDEAIVTTLDDSLHVLPAGHLDTNPHQLLGRGDLQTMLAALRHRYHHIIIDSPPVLSASESLALAREADATLLCTMRNVSRADQVERAHQRLVASGATTIGAVLSGIPISQYARTYGTYHYVRPR